MSQFVSIAIDGPGGAGKSTVAKRLARELGYPYVDTGAFYRTIGYHMSLMGIGPRDKDGIERCIQDVNIRVFWEDGVQHMILNGQDVTNDIRTPEMSMMASGVSAQKCVRDYLLQMQRDLAASQNVIMDGRDIGTVVLPNATVKIFLTASPEIRAERRFLELQQKGEKVRYEDVLKELIERDRQDMNRAIAPLRRADDAVVVDASDRNVDEVVAEVRRIVQESVGTR